MTAPRPPSPCHVCGKVVARIPRTGKRRARHKCPHGRWCVTGDPLLGVHANNPPPTRLGGCSGCWEHVKAEERRAREHREQDEREDAAWRERFDGGGDFPVQKVTPGDIQDWLGHTRFSDSARARIFRMPDPDAEPCTRCGEPTKAVPMRGAPVVCGGCAEEE